MNLSQRTALFRKNTFPIMLCLLFALSAPLISGRDAHAQTQEKITITAHAGLDGFCKADKWLPVHVIVENSGADINARVQTSYKNSVGGQTVDGINISLPATSRKEFFLYVLPQGLMRTFSVSVLDGNKILAKNNLNLTCNSDSPTLFGVLADNPSSYTMLNNVRPLIGVTKTVQLNVADLPDRAQGWGMLDALVISNVDTGTLTSDQKQALKLWLANGGKLFVTGGIQWQSTTAGLADFLPIKLNSTKNVTGLSSLSAYAMDSEALESGSILATGAVQPEGNILVEQDNIPLLVEKQIGYGKVYFFAADPGLQPLNNWLGMQKIYEHLLAFKSPKPSWAFGPWDPYQSSTALATLPELALPSFIYICCWLGLYITIIGPVNYFVLRRLKRTELAWITVPALVIVFTSLAYFSGYIYRGTRPILNRIMLAQAWQGVDQAQANGLIGLYSPSRTTYDVESHDQFLLFPFPDMNENLQGNNNWLSIRNETGTTLPDVRVEIGGMQSMGVDGPLSAISIQHDLAVTLTNKTPALKGKITNASIYTLKDAAIITPSGWKVIGDLKPNESKDISVTLVNNSSSSSTSQYTALAALGWDIYTNNNTAEKRLASFFQATTSSTSGTINVNTGVYLMAWVDNQIPTPVGLQGQEPNATDTLLYFEKLIPTLETKPGAIMLSSSIYSWESSLGDTITTYYYNLSNDGYNIRFQPGLPVHFTKVNSLELIIGANTPPDKIKVSLWNYKTKTWDIITLAFNKTKIPNASQYVGMDGELLMNIAGNQNDYFEITSVDFVLMVQP